MARQIPLPAYDTLPEGVYFHREHPADPELILQIPDAGREDFQTYPIDLDDSVHLNWIKGLKNSRSLRNTLSWARHVAYAPETGHFQEMPDLDTPSESMKMFTQARREASQQAVVARQFALRQRAVPRTSSLRKSLMGR